MYCHQCGAKAFGNFCSQCGAKLMTSDEVPVPAPSDWSNEIRYDVLLRVPEVRDRIARAASQAQKHVSAEQIMKLYDEVFKPAVGVSMTTIVAIAQPIYERLGIKTGKSRTETFVSPGGITLAALLCALARHGHTVNGAEQAQDGCLVHASVSSDFWTFGGDLVVVLHVKEAGTMIEASTVFKGQLYDWGKSNRVLTALFDDVRAQCTGTPG